MIFIIHILIILPYKYMIILVLCTYRPLWTAKILQNFKITQLHIPTDI